MVDGFRCHKEDVELGFFELRVKMNGDSSELAAKLQSHYQALNEQGYEKMIQTVFPKITCNGDYLEIGVAYPYPKNGIKEFNFEATTAVFDKIKECDQKLQLDLQLGASMKDIISKDEPLI